METRKEKAAEKKRCGSHNCTQAVLCTYHDFAGMQGRRIKLNFPSTAYLSSPHSIPLSVVLG